MARTRPSVRWMAAGALLACASLLAAATPSAAGGWDEARTMINPDYVNPEIPAHLSPACQVLVKNPVEPQFGVTSDDIMYCELPYYASRFPSDRCACTAQVGGAKQLLAGMVVWRPANWKYMTFTSRPRFSLPWPFGP